ncbi:uncharacterized protein A1O9_07361 [Exophiala aquamarina CBS 119918]|uniref:Pre-rRNA-processing protein IPI3 n=1 Tax=Exophiala aquamarina CBS 119918 TaxID=1182545 RepID=A0A072PBC9_9EURO|nr:uncharacterized protein A1O9_07361 [Exophiala aquamarina CBS 119918]KEF57171.1 hypothetical protein A1O9_07361 [Exophiala aquamarina CBS 119918]
MPTESFIAATLTTNKAAAHTSAALKDVGVFLYQYQPQNLFSHGYKKSTSRSGCVAVSDSHIFAAQADKAVINVYSRERGNQEATVPFPERIHCIAFADGAALLVLGTEEGKLILWEVATGRLTTSSASHLQTVSSLCVTPNNDFIISGSADTSIHVWSLPRLVSFSQGSGGYEDGEPTNTPVRTFSAHRTAITAIACGHSMTDTNFAISASDDGTCYLWHIGTCQTLRTILLPTKAISIAIDPADRVLYFGGQDGHVYSWDIFRHFSSWKSMPIGSSGVPASQITSKDRWTTPSSERGSTNCLTLSYDGTALVSGHTNGNLIRWDVAKHRILNELTNLGQPVTCIKMLKPDGILIKKLPGYKIINIVKPNLEFSSQLENGTVGIPSKYNFHGIITPSQVPEECNDVEQALTGLGFPQAMIDDALRALAAGSAATSSASNGETADFETQKLTEEVTALKQQLAALNEVEEKRKTRRIARMEQREELGMKKREAYFEAKKKGKDGDAAMKKWEEKEAELDGDSDAEIQGDHMTTD